jgi:DNA-binding response OmpR family regulator
MVPIRVLLADPDESLLAAYRGYLSQDGFEVALATNGLDCLAELRRFQPDVLVMEPALPWGWGDGVLARMRERDDVPWFP